MIICIETKKSLLFNEGRNGWFRAFYKLCYVMNRDYCIIIIMSFICFILRDLKTILQYGKFELKNQYEN